MSIENSSQKQRDTPSNQYKRKPHTQASRKFFSPQKACPACLKQAYPTSLTKRSSLFCIPFPIREGQQLELPHIRNGFSTSLENPKWLNHRIGSHNRFLTDCPVGRTKQVSTPFDESILDSIKALHGTWRAKTGDGFVLRAFRVSFLLHYTSPIFFLYNNQQPFYATYSLEEINPCGNV